MLDRPLLPISVPSIYEAWLYETQLYETQHVVLLCDVAPSLGIDLACSEEGMPNKMSVMLC